MPITIIKGSKNITFDVCDALKRCDLNRLIISNKTYARGVCPLDAKAIEAHLNITFEKRDDIVLPVL